MRATFQAVGRRPALGVELGLIAAWIALVVAMGGAGAGGAGSSGRSLWLCTLDMQGMAPGTSAAGLVSGPGRLAAGLPMWGLMAAAMMLPPALPAVRHVGARSLYWRRRRAMAEFVLAFLAAWIAFSVVVLGLLAPLAGARSGVALAAALGLASLWQLTPLKRRALRACHRGKTLPPHGWRATAGVARFGLFNAGACIASCWAMMLAMATVGAARLVWMAALTGIVAAEKLSLKPGRTRRRVAALLAAAALGTAAAALL